MLILQRFCELFQPRLRYCDKTAKEIYLARARSIGPSCSCYISNFVHLLCEATYAAYN